MSSQLYCPVCAAGIVPGAETCGNCGTRFGGAPSTPTPVVKQKVSPPGVMGIDYAGFWMRLFAFIVDAIPLVGMAVLAHLITDDLTIAVLLSFLFCASYFVGFWAAMDGATPGKMAMGIRVVRVNGESLDVGWSILRFLGYCISVTLLFVGFLMIPFMPQKRGLHDYVAQTVVVRVR
jgi:uncharacterized RDD family membrane protein YckC